LGRTRRSCALADDVRGESLDGGGPFFSEEIPQQTPAALSALLEAD
jgi:hypothetical protein